MKKFKIKSHPMTLIEVLIATFLTMILLSAVTLFYRQVMLMNKESDRLQNEQFKLAYLEKRLSSVIPKIISSTDIHKDFYFFTEGPLNEEVGPYLVFTYDGGVSLQQGQSNHLLGKLFIDENKNLALASWASPKRWDTTPQMKKEILLENVTSLSFEFYVPPKKDRSEFAKKTDKVIEPENSWHKSWSYTYNALPALIKIHITTKIKEDEKIETFAFALPKSNMVIMYE